MKKYTIEEIRNYLNSQDSLGDIHYYLSEKNIDKANEKVKLRPATEDDLFVGCEVWLDGNKETIEMISKYDLDAPYYLEGWDGEDHFSLEELSVEDDED